MGGGLAVAVHGAPRATTDQNNRVLRPCKPNPPNAKLQHRDRCAAAQGATFLGLPIHVRINIVALNASPPIAALRSWVDESATGIHRHTLPVSPPVDERLTLAAATAQRDFHTDIETAINLV